MHSYRSLGFVMVWLVLAGTAGAQRALVTAGLSPVEKGDEQSVRLSAGGAFADAGEGAASAGKVLADLGYQAAHVTADDVEAAGPDAIKSAAAPLVSANLYTADKANRLVKPYLVVSAGGKRIGITGVTATRSQPQGFHVGDPVASLKDVVAQLAKESDVILLVAAMDRVSAAKLMEQYPQIHRCLVSGGIGGGSALFAGGGWVLPAPRAGGGTLSLALVGGEDKTPETQLIAPPEELPEPLLAFRRATPAIAPITVAATTTTAAELPEKLEPGKTVFYNLRAQNRAAYLTVTNATLRDSYGPLTSEAGSHLLVLGTTWENLMPLTLIYQKHVPTEYRIPNLADHLYLVVNGQLVSRVHPNAKAAPGHVPVQDFKLPEIGSRITGNVVFQLPNVPIESLEIRFYDFAHGHAFAQLLKGTPPAPPKPLATAKNEVIDGGVFGVEKLPKLGETAAPAGMQFVVVDFRAVSRFTFEGDATAHDPKARPGQKMKIGTVADWTDSRKHLQLVVDGERGYSPLPQTSLAEQPRFLPDVMTGGRVVFVAPAEATSLELRCDFPNAKMPDGKVARPRGMTLALEGKPPHAAGLKPMAKAEDSVFVVNVLNQSAPDTFAGQKPADGKRWIVLDVMVSTKTQQGEHFQTLEQLKIVDAAAAQSPMDPATFQGVYRPAELLWIPQGDRRAFQVAYQFPANELQPRLAYTGVDKAEVLELARLAPGGAPPAEVAKTPDKPDAPAKVDPPAKVDAPAKPDAPVAGPAKPPAAEKMIDVDGKKFPPRVPVKPNLKAKGIAGFGITPEQVNGSIDKGAEFLWKTLEKDAKESYDLGERREHTIISLALVHADYHKKNPQFDAALRKWLSKYHANTQAGTYEVGIVAMLIEGYGDPTFFPQLRTCAKWLVETQGKDGSWGYGRKIEGKYFAADPNDSRVLKIEGGRPLDQVETITRESEYKVEFEGDTSSTQYALLGLNSVERSGIKIPADVWARALKAHHDRQVKADGGWGYQSPSSPYGSMTAAGICGVALTRFSLNESGSDGAIERGLGWLNAHFSVAKHPENDEWLYYYLYSLERVGRILDTEFIGEHEWYPLGVRFLLGDQKEDGSWIEPRRLSETDIHTSFALLFLTRATPTLVTEKRSGPGTLKTSVLIPPGKKLYIILDASGSMLEEMNGTQKFEIARAALTQLIKELPANAEVGLRAYGYRKRAIEEGASEDTNLLVPVAKLDREKLLMIMAGIRARGKTPMALSLEQARRELPEASEDTPLTVLLLTDGGEDTIPRKDPVKAAAAFADLPHVRFRIVGFDINRDDWSQQLQAMAKVANGQYLPAAQGEALLRELRSAIYETPDEFAVFDDAGKPLGGGKFGDAMKLPAGKYRVRATYAGQTFEESLFINAGSTTAVTFQAANVSKAPGKPAEPAKPAATVAPDTPAAPPVAPAKAKFCTSCGAKLEGAVKFCTGCGAKVP